MPAAATTDLRPESRPEPRKETIASRVAGRLRADILAGRLAPGSKVNLDRLRESLDVSLAPVREAMTRLAAEGLVEVEEQRGYSVAPVSAENLAEITMLRLDLEGRALAQAIARGSLDWEGAVLAALHRLARSPRDAARPDSGEAWEAAHDAFHMALVGGSGMPILTGFCARLRRLNDRYRRLLNAADEPGRDLEAEHAAIARAAVARDAGRAGALLAEHIRRTDTFLRGRLADRPAGPLPG